MAAAVGRLANVGYVGIDIEREGKQVGGTKLGHDYPQILALRPAQKGSRNSRFMILPMVLRGSESRNSTATSRCVLASWPLAHSLPDLRPPSIPSFARTAPSATHPTARSECRSRRRR